MTFEAYDVALDLVRALKPLLAAIRIHDPNLEIQMRKAGSSVPLNLAEGRRRTGKDRSHHYRIAAGSADEIRAGLQVADAWGYAKPEQITPALELVDRVLAMAWRLTRK